MSQPPAYDRAYSFQSYQALNPTLPLPADQVDLEYNRLKVTLDALLANIALIQDDDGGLANGIVGRDQISADIEIGFTVPTKWATSVAYGVSPADTVFHGTTFYRCIVAHTSGVFATDLAAHKWVEIADFSALVQDADLIDYDGGSSGLSADNVQDAIDELADEKLSLAGGTMSGSIAMAGQRITGAPTTAMASASDVATRLSGDLRWQPLDGDLTSIAALTTTAYGRAVLALVNSADARDYFNVEAADILALLLGVDGSGSGLDADKLRGTTPTAFGLSLIDDAAASNARTTLGLGPLALLDYTDLVYVGSNHANLSFPIGTVVGVKSDANSLVRNVADAIRINNAADASGVDYATAASGSGSALTGTWRSSGRSGDNDNDTSWFNFRRVA